MRDRLIARVPERYRKVAGRVLWIGGIAFLAFEITRVWALKGLWLPLWERAGAKLAVLLDGPLYATIPALVVTALAFIIPMTGVLYGYRYFRRRLSR